MSIQTDETPSSPLRAMFSREEQYCGDYNAKQNLLIFAFSNLELSENIFSAIPLVRIPEVVMSFFLFCQILFFNWTVFHSHSILAMQTVIRSDDQRSSYIDGKCRQHMVGSRSVQSCILMVRAIHGLGIKIRWIRVSVFLYTVFFFAGEQHTICYGEGIISCVNLGYWCSNSRWLCARRVQHSKNWSNPGVFWGVHEELVFCRKSGDGWMRKSSTIL